MKLNDEIKRHIIVNATKRMEEKFYKLNVKFTALKEREAMNCMTIAERKIADSLPKGFLGEQNRFSFDLPYLYAKDSFDMSRMKMRPIPSYIDRSINTKPIRVKHIMNRSLPPSKEMSAMYFELVKMYELIQDTRLQLYVRMKDFKTLEKLSESWADCKKYCKGYEVKATTTTALVVRFSDLDEVLKTCKKPEVKKEEVKNA